MSRFAVISIALLISPLFLYAQEATTPKTDTIQKDLEVLEKETVPEAIKAVTPVTNATQKPDTPAPKRTLAPKPVTTPVPVKATVPTPTPTQAQAPAPAPVPTPVPVSTKDTALSIERETVELIDENGDGTAEIKKYYFINENGEKILIRKEIDISGDGKIDYVVYYRNKKPGDDKVESIVVDNDFDGKFDEKRYYSENGSLIKKELDLNFDGRPDVTKRYYNNELVKKEIDTNFDGVVDHWEYYQDGRLARIEIDTDNDGKPDKIGKTQIQEVYKFDLNELKKAPIEKETEKKIVKKKRVVKKTKKPVSKLPKKTLNQIKTPAPVNQ